MKKYEKIEIDVITLSPMEDVWTSGDPTGNRFIINDDGSIDGEMDFVR